MHGMADGDYVICNSLGAISAYLIATFVIWKYRPDRFHSSRESDALGSGKPGDTDPLDLEVKWAVRISGGGSGFVVTPLPKRSSQGFSL